MVVQDPPGTQCQGPLLLRVAAPPLVPAGQVLGGTTPVNGNKKF